MRCNISSSKISGLYRKRDSALKKSRYFADIIEGMSSPRSISSISYLDYMKRRLFESIDLSIRIRPIYVMASWRIIGNMLGRIRSKNHGTKVLKIKAENSRILAF